jgi:hypothetical protein|tara:strand:- start:2027 stop:2332 length:306 start_codon:yes stop_codon:yes gene_type:complete
MNDKRWVIEQKITGPDLRQNLREFLFDGEVEVKFKKLDDSERVMRCTLHPDLIPDAMMPKGDMDPQPTENLDIMKVFDIEVKQWRSFRLENIIYIKTNHTS